MSRPIHLARGLTLAAALAAMTGLGGCVSLFPKAEPTQLYRVNVPAGGAEAAASRPSVALAPIEFTGAASGDRLLTVDGNEAAFIAGARWVTPASEMFDEAVNNAFSGAPGVRLIERRQATGTTPMLSIKVDSFEARYLSGPKSAPTVVVAMTVRLVRNPDRVVLAEKHIEASQAAGDNRVGAIVQAYDAAVGSSLKELVGWTASLAPAAAGH